MIPDTQPLVEALVKRRGYSRFYFYFIVCTLFIIDNRVKFQYFFKTLKARTRAKRIPCDRRRLRLMYWFKIFEHN